MKIVKLSALILLLSSAGCSSGLSIENLKYCSSKDASSARVDAGFKKGETVYLLFDVRNFKRDSSEKAHVQEDLLITAPDDKEIVDKKNLTDYNQLVPDKQKMSINNEIKLPGLAPPGTYSVTLTLRDLNAGTTVTQSSKFAIASP